MWHGDPLQIHKGIEITDLRAFEQGFSAKLRVNTLTFVLI